MGNEEKEPNTLDIFLDTYLYLIMEEVERFGKDVETRRKSLVSFMRNTRQKLRDALRYELSEEEEQKVNLTVGKTEELEKEYSYEFDQLVSNMQERLETTLRDAKKLDSELPLPLDAVLRIGMLAKDEDHLKIIRHLYVHGFKTGSELADELDVKRFIPSISHLSSYGIIKSVEIDDVTHFTLEDQFKVPATEIVLDACYKI